MSCSLPWSYLISHRGWPNIFLFLFLGQSSTLPQCIFNEGPHVGWLIGSLYVHFRPINGVERGIGAARLAVILLPVFCCWLLSLCDSVRQTDSATAAKPLAVADLLHVSRGARLAVVAICLLKGQRDRNTDLSRSDLAPKAVWRRDARWSTQAAPEFDEREWGCRWICTAKLFSTEGGVVMWWNFRRRRRS